MKRLKIKYLLLGLALILSLFIIVGCSLPFFGSTSTTTSTTSVPSETTTVTTSSSTWTPPVTQAQNPLLPDFVSVVNKVKPSVVAINAELTAYDIFGRPFTQEVAGSGWILDKNGLIATNNHVIDGATSISVTLADNTVLTATIVGADALADLAVLKVNKTDLPAASVGDSTKLQVGQWVLTIGNAQGEGISTSEGIVSRTGASITVDTGQTLSDMIQTSAPINPGNSGGPLVNLAGEVVGITSAKLAALGVEGMGYAISTKTALPIIEALVKNGYVVRPYLGVDLQTVNAYTVLRYNLAVSSGAFISIIITGTPADAAGLKVGDVIVNFNGKDTKTADDALSAIHSAKVGQTVDITYWRGSSQYTTQATLIESPPP
jgi:serine protease Do